MSEEIKIHIESDDQYRDRMFETFKSKAAKWDALAKEIEGEYGTYDEDGEFQEHPDEPDQDHDLSTIGEIAATAFGWI
jgi:hypothetical protein